ncbi:MAG: NUDIX hydrolase [Rhodobacteraceae bacterium]|nr:MAG: NUDIX hydrolase [Paracoccaceae bacterium]
MTKPRLAVRAIILQNNRLLMVNAWPEGKSDLWCAPGGGVEAGTSLPENLQREVQEECGLIIAVGAPCLVNEFHDPAGTFHQVDIYFHAEIVAGALDPTWRDPEGIVTTRRFVTEPELRQMRFKPDLLPQLAWGAAAGAGGALYDPLEPIIR